MIENTTRQNVHLFVLFIIILLIPGCFGGNAPKVTYYSLSSAEWLGEVNVVASLPDVTLGVGPITLPGSLKRSQVVTRQSTNQYVFDDFHRWSGDLEKDVTSVLGQNLSILLGVGRVGVFPWDDEDDFQPTYLVEMNIIRLDGALDGEAVLSARWTVVDAEEKTYLGGGKIVCRQPLEETGYESLVKAESQVLADLSKEFAGEFLTLLK